MSYGDRMRIPEFQQLAVQAYRAAPEVESAEPFSDGTKRPYGVEIRLRTGTTVRHAMTRVRVDGEDLDQSEPEGTGTPPEPVEGRPEPKGSRDRATAQFLAACLADTGDERMSTVYAYGEEAQHPGVGVQFHNGSKIHLLLV